MPYRARSYGVMLYVYLTPGQRSFEGRWIDQKDNELDMGKEAKGMISLATGDEYLSLRTCQILAFIL